MKITNERLEEIIREEISEAKKRDYKAEYKKFQSSTKSKKYRAELNKLFLHNIFVKPSF